MRPESATSAPDAGTASNRASATWWSSPASPPTSEGTGTACAGSSATAADPAERAFRPGRGGRPSQHPLKRRPRSPRPRARWPRTQPPRAPSPRRSEPETSPDGWIRRDPTARGNPPAAVRSRPRPDDGCAVAWPPSPPRPAARTPPRNGSSPHRTPPRRRGEGPGPARRRDNASCEPEPHSRAGRTRRPQPLPHGRRGVHWRQSSRRTSSMLTSLNVTTRTE